MSSSGRPSAGLIAILPLVLHGEVIGSRRSRKSEVGSREEVAGWRDSRPLSPCHLVSPSPSGDEGQPQSEGAALAFHALDSDGAAVLGDDLFGPGQPDPGTGDVPLHVSAAPETVKDVG